MNEYGTPVGPDYADERTNRGLVNGRGTPVERDLSPPPPIYRPVGTPLPTPIIVLNAIKNSDAYRYHVIR